MSFSERTSYKDKTAKPTEIFKFCKKYKAERAFSAHGQNGKIKHVLIDKHKDMINFAVLSMSRKLPF